MSDYQSAEHPDLFDAEEEIESLVSYFEELEANLAEKTDAPIQLVQTQTARSVSLAISRHVEAERAANRAWKHVEPSEVAKKCIRLLIDFRQEHSLTLEQLANELLLPVRALERLEDAPGLGEAAPGERV